MPESNLNNAVLFLISTIFDLYIFVLIIRLFLAAVSADYSHPITQLVVKLTGFIVKPVKKFLPDFRGFETATFAVILLVEIIKWIVIFLLSFGFPNILGLFIVAISDAIKLILDVLFYMILLQALISLINPAAPINRILQKITSPILRPFQRIIPPVAGFDLSPLPVLIILQLLIIFVMNKFYWVGMGIAVG